MLIVVQFFGCLEEMFLNLNQLKELLNNLENMDRKNDKRVVVVFLFKMIRNFRYFYYSDDICVRKCLKKMSKQFLKIFGVRI